VDPVRPDHVVGGISDEEIFRLLSCQQDPGLSDRLKALADCGPGFRLTEVRMTSDQIAAIARWCDYKPGDTVFGFKLVEDEAGFRCVYEKVGEPCPPK
jgi:hypothetical protein